MLDQIDIETIENEYETSVMLFEYYWKAREMQYLYQEEANESFFEKIRNGFMKIIDSIVNFFKKLFNKNKDVAEEIDETEKAMDEAKREASMGELETAISDMIDGSEKSTDTEEPAPSEGNPSDTPKTDVDEPETSNGPIISELDNLNPEEKKSLKERLIAWLRTGKIPTIINEQSEKCMNTLKNAFRQFSQLLDRSAAYIQQKSSAIVALIKNEAMKMFNALNQNKAAVSDQVKNVSLRVQQKYDEFIASLNELKAKIDKALHDPTKKQVVEDKLKDILGILKSVKGSGQKIYTDIKSFSLGKKIMQGVSNTFNKAKSTISDRFNKTKQTVSNGVNQIKTRFNDTKENRVRQRKEKEQKKNSAKLKQNRKSTRFNIHMR